MPNINECFIHFVHIIKRIDKACPTITHLVIIWDVLVHLVHKNTENSCKNKVEPMNYTLNILVYFIAVGLMN